LKVFIILHGDKGTTEKLSLVDSLPHGSHIFYPGALDVFNVSATNVGKLYSVSIQSDGWHVKAIEVTNLDTEEVSFFIYDSVVNGEVTLQPSGQTEQLVDEYPNNLIDDRLL
jgi:hypothetical protein